MKHAPILIASISALLAIAACAAPSASQSEEKLGSTSQALCRVGTCDTPDPGTSGGLEVDPGDDPLPKPPRPKWPGTSGGLTSSGVVEPDPMEFQCESDVARCELPGYLRLSCDDNPIKTEKKCVCMEGCGGAGGYPFGTYNPCPSYARDYVCNSAGTCRCTVP